jgi:copper chaperone
MLAKPEIKMTQLSVPDMSCNHCKASVETALAPLASAVMVDLTSRRVTVEGVDPLRAISALAEIGFPATLVPA